MRSSSKRMKALGARLRTTDRQTQLQTEPRLYPDKRKTRDGERT
jgi:hypothetical protein